ncbi:MAG TPA: hypothetical protein PLI58_07725 [Candidatus Syntrophosphaera sp.]|nr:hypothetical protein [Candidatus Syntrophosphaera sp.]
MKLFITFKIEQTPNKFGEINATKIAAKLRDLANEIQFEGGYPGNGNNILNAQGRKIGTWDIDPE